MTTQQAYLKYLEKSLAAQSKMDGVGVQVIASKFLIESNKTSPRQAFYDVMEAYGNEDTNSAIESIETQLTRFATTNSIDVNPISRMVSKVAKKNAWIKCMQLEGISDADNKKLQNKALSHVPDAFLPKIEPKFTKYSATAQTKSGKATKLEIEYSV